MQPLKARLPIDVTEEGISTCSNAVHCPNVHSLIEVTNGGIVTFVSPVQEHRANDPIDVKDCGNSIVFNKTHPEKAWSPIAVIDE